MSEQLNLNDKINDASQLDLAAENFTNIITNAAKTSTTYRNFKPRIAAYPAEIMQLIKQHRQVRRKWFKTRNSYDKTAYNKLTKKVKSVLFQFKNDSFHLYLESLSPSKDSDYSLWKATRKIRRPLNSNPPLKADLGEWVRDDYNKANLFASYMESVFQPNEIISDVVPISIVVRTEKIKHTSPLEIAEILEKSKPTKSPGPDNINADTLRELPKKGIIYITTLINSALCQKSMPDPWKLANVIMLLKPGKTSRDCIIISSNIAFTYHI